MTTESCRAAARVALLLLTLLAALPAAPDDGRPAAASRARLELGTGAAFAPDGTLFAVSKEGEHLVLRRSADGGTRWSPPTLVNVVSEAIAASGDSYPKLAFTADGGVLVAWSKPLAKPHTGEIRLARSEDGGLSFAAPITVHHDRAEITHRFESLAVGADNLVTVAWIDKRDLEAAKAGQADYRGAAIYSAVSRDGGRTFAPERKVADHSCECCRIATAHDPDGAPLLLWRHVFAPNERDHALARLKPDGTPESVRRASFERWKIDGCPHHGPSLTVDARGTRHAVWFNDGRVHYGRLVEAGDGLRVEGQRPVGGPRAAHADLGVAGGRLAIVWKEFDGERTRLHALVSADGGESFAPRELAATAGASDQPRLIRRGDDFYAFWRTEQENFLVVRLP